MCIFSTSVVFSRGTLNSPEVVNIETYTNEEQVVNMTGNKAPGQPLSSYIRLDDFTPASGRSASIEMSVSGVNLDSNTKIYRANANSQWSFQELETRNVNGMAVADTNQGGIFVVAQQQVAIYVTVATIVLILAVLVIAIGGVTIYFKVRPEKWQATKAKVSGGAMSFKRSFAKKV